MGLKQKGFSADLMVRFRAAKGSPALGREASPVSGLLWFRFWTLEKHSWKNHLELRLHWGVPSRDHWQVSLSGLAVGGQG